MSWHPFGLDNLAHQIVLNARRRDPDSLNQAYKMRAACAYGLERFWGEHLRLADKEIHKAALVADVWKAFTDIMRNARPDIQLPGVMLSKQADENLIQSLATQIWAIPVQDHHMCLSTLSSLCDAVVWWSQRLRHNAGSKAHDSQRELPAMDKRSAGWNPR